MRKSLSEEATIFYWVIRKGLFEEVTFKLILNFKKEPESDWQNIPGMWEIIKALAG